MIANEHWEEDCYNCMYYYHDYWNCQGAEKPCHEYSHDDEAEDEA